MTITNPLTGARRQTAESATGPQLVLAGALAAVLTVGAVFQNSVPADALLPGVSVLFFVMAAVVALIAWQRPIPIRHFSYWDSAGILVLIGIGIAAMVEPDQMVRLVAGTDRIP